MALPILPIAAGAIALFLLSQKKEGSYSVAPSDGSSPPVKEPAPPAKTWREMPETLQEQVASALGQLGVSPATGQLSGGVVSADAIKFATQTAALCEAQGFYDVAKQLRGYAEQAAHTVPSPPEVTTIKASAPPGLTDAEKEAIGRTLAMDRDPKVLQALLVRLQALQPSPERDHFIQMTQALILQLQSAQSTTQTLQQIDQVIKSPGIAEVHAAVQPLPPAVIPVITPPPPPPPLPPIVLPPPVLTAPTPPPLVPLPPNPPPPPATSATAEATSEMDALSYAALLPLTGNRILKLAAPLMTGTDVLAWQTILRRDGFAGSVKADKVFGPATQLATKQWQSSRGLVADGQVGPATRGKVGLPLAPMGGDPLSRSPSATPLPQVTAPAGTPGLVFAKVVDPTPNAKVLKAGAATKAETTSWQNILTALGYGGIVGKVDGSWGPKTTEATKALQLYAQTHYRDSKPITVDGTVGPQTRRIVVARTAELKGVVVSGTPFAA
jgi:peptidoglycan hydrolase-like protein with peptidoglycan-binding domain